MNDSTKWLDAEGIEAPFSLKKEITEHGKMSFVFEEGEMGKFNDQNVMHYTVKNLRDDSKVTFMTTSIAVIAGLKDAKAGETYEVTAKPLGSGKSTYTVTKSGEKVGMDEIPVIETGDDVPF